MPRLDPEVERFVLRLLALLKQENVQLEAWSGRFVLADGKTIGMNELVTYSTAHRWPSFNDLTPGIEDDDDFGD